MNKRTRRTEPTPTTAAAGSPDQAPDLLIGMKAICRYIGKTEVTVLKYHRELDLPIRKSDKNGTSGQWISSKTKIDQWAQDLVEG